MGGETDPSHSREQGRKSNLFLAGAAESSQVEVAHYPNS